MYRTWSPLRSKTNKKRVLKNSETLYEKKDAGYAIDACQSKTGGGFPLQVFRRTTIQANASKLTRANKLSQSKPRHYEHSTGAGGTVADSVNCGRSGGRGQRAWHRAEEGGVGLRDIYQH